MLLAVTSAVASSANDSSGRLSAAKTPKVGPGVACVWVDPIKDPVAFRVVPIFLPPTAKNGGESAEQSKGKKNPTCTRNSIFVSVDLRWANGRQRRGFFFVPTLRTLDYSGENFVQIRKQKSTRSSRVSCVGWKRREPPKN